MQMQIADRWLMDMPQQFLGKHNIEVLVKAFAKQLQELQMVFDDLNTKLDLETATGKNLDYVGTILPLSRKEAGELAEIGVTEPVISDERYRRFMKYKILRNTSECTYYDLVAGIELLWGYENIHYKEDPEHPAMIVFETPMLSLDEADPVEFHANLCIRASGVGVFLRKIYWDSFYLSVSHFMTITFTTSFYPRYNLPELLLDGTWVFDGSRKLSGYDSEEQIDFYPVCVKFETKTVAKPRERTQLHLLMRTEAIVKSPEMMAIKASAKCNAVSAQRMGLRMEAVGTPEEEIKVSFALGGAKEQVESRQRVTVQVSAECEERIKESMAMQMAVPVRARGGDVIVENRNLLDGTWLLDGSRKLNGGYDVL